MYGHLASDRDPIQNERNDKESRILEQKDQADNARSVQARAKQIAAARASVEKYYEEQVEILDDVLPAAVFHATLMSQFPDGITPEESWNKAQQLLEQLHAMVRENKNRKPDKVRRSINPDDV